MASSTAGSSGCSGPPGSRRTRCGEVGDGFAACLRVCGRRQRHPHLGQAGDPFTPAAEVDRLERPRPPARRAVTHMRAPMPYAVHARMSPKDPAICAALHDLKSVLEDAVLAPLHAHNTRAHMPTVQGQTATRTAAHLGCLRRRSALPQVDRQPITGSRRRTSHTQSARARNRSRLAVDRCPSRPLLSFRNRCPALPAFEASDGRPPRWQPCS